MSIGSGDKTIFLDAGIYVYGTVKRMCMSSPMFLILSSEVEIYNARNAGMSFKLTFFNKYGVPVYKSNSWIFK